MSRPKSMAQRTNADDTPDAKNQRKLYSKAKTHTHMVLERCCHFYTPQKQKKTIALAI